MFWLRGIAAIVLLTAILSPAAMACMAAEAQMTLAEHACCRRMAHQCGSMSSAMHGESSHSCCKPEVQSPTYAAQRDVSPSFELVWLPVQTMTAVDAIAEASPAGNSIPALAHSPPAAAHSEILRI